MKKLINRNIAHIKHSLKLKNDADFAKHINSKLAQVVIPKIHATKNAKERAALVKKYSVTDRQVNSYLYNNVSPKNEVMLAMAKLVNISTDDLISTDLEKNNMIPIQSAARIIADIEQERQENTHTLNIYSQNIDKSYLVNNMVQEPTANITYAEELRAAAGGLFNDGWHKNAESSGFHLPFLPKGDYRAFEISGDSMEPVPSGSIVIAKKVNKESLKTGKTYIIIANDGSIVYKRVIYDNPNTPTVILYSDNIKYDPYHILFDDIADVWEKELIILSDEISDGAQAIQQWQKMHHLYRAGQAMN